jgi:hypothetical protein
MSASDIPPTTTDRDPVAASPAVATTFGVTKIELARGSIPTPFAVAFTIIALVLEAASLVFYSAAAGYSTAISVPPIVLLASGQSGARLIEWGSLVDMFGYLCIAPVVLYLRDRYAGAQAINLYAVAGIALVVVGTTGDVVMRAAAPYLIRQYQVASPAGRHSIDFVFGVLYRGVVEGMWQTLVALLAAIWLLGTAYAARGRASRTVLVIMLVIGLATAAIGVFRLTGL